ncbi:hypothetical protein HJC23_009974 [Cyclotella cryptica]|uniref:Protein kinase domain-containing protein n=1 Tax=Cyclotella cryptica TaxID=29204 RepID=A0ABD3Q850_9STRA|eukprot:CCRYP_007755-RA/>CCRYP_007755-RA protein AED:0.04 eAED:0.04 QI:0/0/0/1/1/1/3/0/471
MSDLADLVDSNTNETCEELTLSNGIGTGLLQNDSVWCRFKFLKKLDLNNSELSTLPSGIEALSPTLEILFLSENNFEAFPECLGNLNRLRMLSLRGNRLTELSSSNLPKKSLVWLILTNNQISRIDPNVGELKELRKLMLSHNKLSSIPSELEGCKNLELVRLANNEITTELPKEFVTLPKLAWISLAGNPIAHCPQTKEKEILKSSVSFTESDVLGKGASGIVYAGKYSGKDVAVKIFKQQSMGSDGNPEDEAAINALIDHPLAVSALGFFLCDENEKHEGMVMPLLDGAKTIGRVPSFDTVTRDAGPTNDAIDLDRESVLSIVWNVATALEHVHRKAGVSNGDVYLHNILMCKVGTARISDWGASFIYDGNHDFADVFERIEVLAFGRLVQDLFDWYLNSSLPDLTEPADFLGRTRGVPLESGPFYDLVQSILQPDQHKRPSFKEIKSTLSQLPEFERARHAADRVACS